MVLWVVNIKLDPGIIQDWDQERIKTACGLWGQLVSVYDGRQSLKIGDWPECGWIMLRVAESEVDWSALAKALFPRGCPQIDTRISVCFHHAKITLEAVQHYLSSIAQIGWLLERRPDGVVFRCPTVRDACLLVQIGNGHVFQRQRTCVYVTWVGVPVLLKAC